MMLESSAEKRGKKEHRNEIKLGNSDWPGCDISFRETE